MNKRRSSIFAVLGFSLIAYSSSVRAEQEFTDLVAKVMPSVVNIAIEAMGQRVKLEQSGGDLAYATYVVEYVGAGSIVDPSGLIITNRHVVKDAYEIDVTLSDGATFKGQLLGAGSGTDLAILKIDAGRPLPAIEIGNSDEVKVGEKVIAIGNPLGQQRFGWHRQRRTSQHEKSAAIRVHSDRRFDQSREFWWPSHKYEGPNDRHRQSDSV